MFVFYVRQSNIVFFVNRKKMADYILAYLCDQDFPTASIHSDRVWEDYVTALNNLQEKNMKNCMSQRVATRGYGIYYKMNLKLSQYYLKFSIYHLMFIPYIK